MSSKNYDDGYRDGAAQDRIDAKRFHDEQYREGLQKGRADAINAELLASKRKREGK